MLSDEIKSLTKGSMLTEEEAKYVEEAGFNPMDIVNFKEFKKFYEISQKPILNEKKIRIATDGREVNLAWLPHIFKKKMEGLSKAEYAKFDALRMVYLRNMGEMNRSRQFAIGANTKGMYGQARAFKILDERKTELIELFGRFFSVTEVLQVVVEEWGIGVSRMTMNRFAQAYAEEIREKQEWYKKNYSDVRLGYKRSRLDELSYLYTAAKIKYNTGNKSNDTGRLMVSILQQIKAEVEGDIDIRVSGSIDMNIEHTLSVHVRHELMKSLNINSLIISRVALKLGLDPIILMNRLQSSYYKKFTTLNGDSPANPDTMELPSKLPYDFKQIQDAQVVIDTAEAKRAAELKKEQEKQNELGKEAGFKDRLLQMLREKDEEMKVAKRRVNVLSMGREAREADAQEDGGLKRLDKKNTKAGWTRGKKRKKKMTTEERIAKDILKVNQKKDLS